MAPLLQGLAESWAPALAAGLATIVLTRRVLAWLHHRQILDHPNERSSHDLPVPRGGGLATTPVMAALLMALAWKHDLPAGFALAAGALILLAISWWDDRHTLPALPRFAAQGAVIAACLILAPAHWQVFGGVLPLALDRVLAGLGWLWFVNLYNFMDGIDGITGVETASVGGGIVLVAGLTGASVLMAPALMVAAVGAGFLWWNWHRAKIFLGDSGSVPFGFVLGGLLLLLATHGQLAAALILPAYYVADSSITLTRRALNGEKVWQAHRKHFYQRAVQGGKRHDQVVLAILATNVLLIGCAVLAALGQVWEGSAAAILVTAGLLALLQWWSRGKP